MLSPTGDCVSVTLTALPLRYSVIWSLVILPGCRASQSFRPVHSISSAFTAPRLVRASMYCPQAAALPAFMGLLLTSASKALYQMGASRDAAAAVS